MSFDELLPTVRSLPQIDEVRLIQVLAADLLPGTAQIAGPLPALAPGDYSLWSPYGSREAAATLLASFEVDSRA